MVILDFPKNIPQFGDRHSSCDYKERYVVYGVGFNKQGKVLISRVRGKFALPGGGINKGETAKQALKREFLEETGWKVKIVKEICRANEWNYSIRKERHNNKIGRFFLVKPIKKLHHPLDKDHEGQWMTYAKASQHLHKKFQLWALKRCAPEGFKWPKKTVSKRFPEKICKAAAKVAKKKRIKKAA